MLISEKNSFIISQREHARLSAALALHWGNDTFDAPKISREDFVLGVCCHDRGYPALDTTVVPERDPHEWLERQRRGFAIEFSNRVADLIVCFHIRRLLGYQRSPERDECARELDASIDAKLNDVSLTRNDFEWIDRITAFCDSLAFDFSLERPGRKVRKVFTKWGENTEAELSYEVVSSKEVRVEPWPFSVDKIEDFIVTYRPEGYPDSLDPEVRLFRVIS